MEEKTSRYVYVPQGLEDHYHTFENRTGGDDLLEIWQDHNRDDDLRKLAWQEHFSRLRSLLLVPSPWPSKETMEAAWRYFDELKPEQQIRELQEFVALANAVSSAYERGRDVELFPENGGRDPYGRYWNVLKRNE